MTNSRLSRSDIITTSLLHYSWGLRHYGAKHVTGTQMRQGEWWPCWGRELFLITLPPHATTQSWDVAKLEQCLFPKWPQGYIGRKLFSEIPQRLMVEWFKQSQCIWETHFWVFQRWKCLSIPPFYLVLDSYTGQKSHFAYFPVLTLASSGQVCFPLWSSGSGFVWRVHVFLSHRHTAVCQE